MPLVIDLLMLVLLVGTVGYAFLVERRVRALMQVLTELEPMVGEFSAAVDKSESSVGMLRSLAQALPGSITGRGAAKGAEAAGREPSVRPAGVRRIAGKSDLVRGFFEAARGREA
jgi:hypothetical protein